MAAYEPATYVGEYKDSVATASVLSIPCASTAEYTTWTSTDSNTSPGPLWYYQPADYIPHPQPMWPQQPYQPPMWPQTPLNPPRELTHPDEVFWEQFERMVGDEAVVLAKRRTLPRRTRPWKLRRRIARFWRHLTFHRTCRYYGVPAMARRRPHDDNNCRTCRWLRLKGESA